MKFLEACATTLVAVLALGTAPASAQTVDELVQKYYAARGGYDKIKAIQTLKITQTVANPFNSTKMVVLKKRPNLIRWEITPAGQTTPLPRIINAEGGWDTQPQGKVVPRPEIIVQQERDIDGDIDGMLVDWKEKGHSVTVEGTETIRKNPAIKLKVVTKAGATREIFLDGTTFLPVREAGRISHPPAPNGQPRFNDHVFTYSDWREVSGVKFPFAIDEERTGGPITQSFATWVEKIEVNVPVEDALFAKPGAPPGGLL